MNSILNLLNEYKYDTNNTDFEKIFNKQMFFKNLGAECKINNIYEISEKNAD